MPTPKRPVVRVEKKSPEYTILGATRQFVDFFSLPDPERREVLLGFQRTVPAYPTAHPRHEDAIRPVRNCLEVYGAHGIYRYRDLDNGSSIRVVYQVNHPMGTIQALEANHHDKIGYKLTTKRKRRP